MTATQRTATAQQRVLDAAIELFAARGFDDVTMAEIAQAAGVARASVFNYFGSKGAIVEAFTETVLDFHRQMLDTALADEATPTPALVRSLFEQMGTGIENQRRLFRGVFREIAHIQLGLESSESAQQAIEDAHARVVRLVERGQQRGDLSDRFSAETIAEAYRALANGTITGWLYHESDPSLVSRMRDASEILLASIERGTP